MAENLFGYEITKSTKQPDVDDNQRLKAFTPKQDEDGALTVASGNVWGQVVDIDGMVKNDSELITRYRNMADHPSVSTAITAIVNEAIINEPEEDTVKLDLSKTKFSAGIKSKIEDEFQTILNMYNFDQMGYEMFRRWYTDGRLYYHAMIDFKRPGDGIQELRYIDPRKIRRVKEVEVTPAADKDASLVKPTSDYYIFNENGFDNGTASKTVGASSPAVNRSFKISKDAIVHITSGLMDGSGKSVVSYLHKAIVPLNKLNMLEQAVIIYRLARAPERRVFSVDVSGMQPAKAEQYLNQLITNAKNKVSYDPTTGQLTDQRKFNTMLEDIWLPNRDGRGTKVDTLPGGENLGKMEDVEYMKQMLYQALEVPVSRLTNDDAYSLGRATEISREEIAFEKFITRLRSRFSLVILKALRLQLLLKRVITIDDWNINENLIGFQYAKDNLFAELKDNEVMLARLNLLGMMQPYIGRFFSNEQVRHDILKQTDQDIKQIDKQISDEQNDPQYLDALDEDGQGALGGPPGGGQ